MPEVRYVECDTITDKIAMCEALQEEHWDEIARNKHLMVLSPDVSQYRRLEQGGRLFAIVAYAGAEIIGYSVNIISTNLHYSDLVMANNDLLFVGKAHRAGRVGMRLIQETENAAAKRGARMVMWHAKENTPLADILPRIGCTVQDIIFSKELPASNFRFYGNLDVMAALFGDMSDPCPISGLGQLAPAELWDAFTARQNAPGSPHHDTRCIVLRGPAADVITSDVVFNMLESVDTPAVEMLPAVRDLCAAACRRIRAVALGRVMLVELAPGGHIDRHVDEGAYAEHFERFHLVLQSDEGNTFHNGAEAIHMKPGELWKFNHRAEHEVFNQSARPRIHLIIDAITE
jgi:GNAT superfamily N-acetyltransferase